MTNLKDLNSEFWANLETIFSGFDGAIIIDTEGTIMLPPYDVHSAAIHYRPFRMLEFHLKADNIFDKNFEEEVGFPSQGRTVTGGLTVTF